MRTFRTIGLEILLFLLHIGIFLKKILFALWKRQKIVLFWLGRRFLRGPLVGAYKLYLKLQSRLERFGTEIKNPFLYALSSKTIATAVLFGIGGMIVLANINLRETTPDVEHPRNVLAHIIERSDEMGGDIEEETSIPSGDQTYAVLSGVQPPLPRMELDEALADDVAPPGQIAVNSGALIKPILPTTQKRVSTPTSNRTYVVVEGDTISTIAAKFGLKMTTILWSNALTQYSTLRIGQRLVILPRDGILYRVRSGDTLAAIAHQFQTTVDKIAAANSLASDRIAIGRQLMIPDAVMLDRGSLAQAQKPSIFGRIKNLLTPRISVPKSLSGALSMLWPTTARRITQYFSWRHSGIDIAGPPSNKILAAAAGVVEISGWQRGYGYTILLNHGNGKKTRYGHASKLFVRVGESVAKGETIAMVGSTGRSTGPHLHFEILIGGRRTNPLSFVR
ncbi:peptidoglycan DD-metalloendopeptidase family protein [Candidatus Uhrbacteria bacterium]|nr:peptidoglycan DD-metalloendopeptidase family protein [Candidatus Uhrbacteria bacterium]